jgi:hypothetical protein
MRVEQLVLDRIKEKFKSACLVPAYKGYDIWVPEINAGVEVKYDPMSKKTGNIVVEYEMNNKDSALMTTEAKWWVFYDDEKFVWITPKKIIKCIFDNKLRYVEFVGRGDTKAKKAFLIPKDVLYCYGEGESLDAL